MAIQSRRGAYADFDPNKMLPGEWAVVTSGDPNDPDGRAIYLCYIAGIVERMATYEDMKKNVQSAAKDVYKRQGYYRTVSESRYPCRAHGQV